MYEDWTVDPSFECDQPKTEIKDSKWEYNGKYMINNGFPLQLDIELNTTCNYNCIMCVRHFCKPKAEYMDFELAQDIIKQGAENKVESIKLQYRGEPLLYPQLFQIIILAKIYGIYVHFNTNGSLLTKEKTKTLIYSGLDKIICSIDSMFPKVYNKIRENGDFRTVLDNLTSLHFYRQVYNMKTPLIRVQAVKQELNKKELEDKSYHTFWSLVADSIGVEECFDLMDNLEDDTELPNWHCGQLWQRLIILAGGEVIPCCGGIDFKGDKIYSIGNVNKEMIKDIWNSKKLNKIREFHMKGESHKLEMCRKCRIRKLVIKKMEENKNEINK